MKYLPFILLLLIAFSCSINSDYVTQTETKTVNNNGVKSSVRITKKLRKTDKLPVSILVESKSRDVSFEGLDSIYYDASGNTIRTRSFEKKNGQWVLIRSQGRDAVKAL
ncbi:hypothetical protein U0035_12915 [Niabella yanshanensis]|uniref:Uncharacterized protein n=1 Tax=Niabella yanshanensis TaxID=577386 RepID=A0ABZ0W1X6_9BACT|nr:hypothetical protein [Niabella yanshanensis]WQD36569.1 hypothetical protein U0035_12915 [Niabella yanshanensis]